MSTIELAWAITSYVYIIAIMISTGICLGYFVRPYLKSKKAAICVGMVYVTVMLILYLIPPHIDNFTAYAIGMLAAFVVMCVEEHRNIEQKIFLTVTFFALRWLSIAMAGKVDEILYDMVVQNAYVADNIWLQYGMYVFTKVLEVGISVALIMVVTYYLNRAFTYKRANMRKTELLMLIMPSLSAMTGYGILQFYQTIYEQDTGKKLLSVYGIYGALSFLNYAISIVAILVMVIMFQNLKARQEETAGQKLLQNQIADMKKHISEVEKLHKDIRLLRHDMGNHIQTIEHLIEHNEVEEAVKYTAGLKETWQGIVPAIRTGNPVTDVILLEKKKQAEENNIKFESDFHYPENCSINAFDISIILNNTLDNSLESVGGIEPYIKVSSYRKKNIFMIVIENSFEGKLFIDEDSELPVSTKKGSEHGLGLINTRRVARKYLGDIAFEQEKGKVIVTAMLQME